MSACTRVVPNSSSFSPFFQCFARAIGHFELPRGVTGSVWPFGRFQVSFVLFFSAYNVMLVAFFCNVYVGFNAVLPPLRSKRSCHI